jgi:hypothetical protein
VAALAAAIQSSTSYQPIGRCVLKAKILFGARRKSWYLALAFVALVTPLDSMKGLQGHTCGLFCFTAGGGRAAQTA